jgi:hypothetical protein
MNVAIEQKEVRKRRGVKQLSSPSIKAMTECKKTENGFISDYRS